MAYYRVSTARQGASGLGLSALRDSGAEFMCADMPEANTLTIGVMATLAQHERAGVPPGWRSRASFANGQRITLREFDVYLA